MKTISIKIKRGVSSASIVENGEIRAKIFKMILFCLAGLAVFYVVFLGKMVSDIIARRSLESQTRILANEVGELELQYLSISDKIDLDLSYELGFKEASPRYATRKSLGSISLVKNEI